MKDMFMGSMCKKYAVYTVALQVFVNVNIKYDDNIFDQPDSQGRTQLYYIDYCL